MKTIYNPLFAHPFVHPISYVKEYIPHIYNACICTVFLCFLWVLKVLQQQNDEKEKQKLLRNVNQKWNFKKIRSHKHNSIVNFHQYHYWNHPQCYVSDTRLNGIYLESEARGRKQTLNWENREEYKATLHWGVYKWQTSTQHIELNQR